jgi:eukaryotic-like serine/threonine-protein kinase
MTSTANHPFDHQGQSEVSSSQSSPMSDGLLPQYFDGYRIVERLGGGAMATVYRAVDLESTQEVALKVLAPGADNVLRERFRVEARTVSVLEHPHIVRTLRVGQVQAGFPYIAMELVEGDSLGGLLERQNQLSVADSCLLLEPVARALAYAHSHYVIHRDVKPSNILLRHVQPGTPNSIQLSAFPTPVIPLLSDFGIARALDAPELTAAGRTIGTPAYMSPEQCSGTRNLDGRADIYSLATVLYRCLVGRPPFMGATTQILHAHVYETLTIPDILAQALPPAILSILQRALQKSPEDRYADMGLFANDLSALMRYIRVQRNGVEDSTLTMPLLTALQPELEKKTAHVLVSGIIDQNSRPLPSAGRSEPATPPTGEAAIRNPLINTRTTQSGAAATTKPKSTSMAAVPQRSSPPRPTNWIYVLVGALLSVALIILAVTAILNILDNQSTNPESELPAAVVQTIVPTITVSSAISSPVVSGDLTPPNSSVPTNGGMANEGSVILPATPTISPTFTVTTSGVTSATQISPGLGVTRALTTGIAYDAGNMWKEDVLFFYRDRDWRQTRRLALEVFSAALQAEANVSLTTIVQMSPEKQAELIAETLLKNRDAAFWRQWQDVISPTEVEQVLFDTYVGIANQENGARRPGAALAYLDAALLVRENADLVKKLNAATARYANASGNLQVVAAEALSTLYAEYATQLAAATSFCPAAEYLAVANALGENNPSNATLQSYQEQCTDLQPTVALDQPLLQSSGAFIYSTEESGRYNIYRAPIGGENQTPVLLVENGSQPGVSLDGRYMAFYSRRSNSLGLRLYDFTAPRSAQADFPQLSGNIEDSSDSAPSWETGSNRLAFSSEREGDRVARIYVTSAPDRGNAVPYDFGEDPAWSLPINGQSLIAYKGSDNTGNNPGLWLLTGDGGKVESLTTNGSDRRPVWSRDGQQVIFMRQLDGGNWDLFQIRLGDRTETRLTNHPAQDGLPTISPDGRWVAFATDRTGRWEIWQVALNGSSEPQPVMPIQGVLDSWLEHAIQWVN